MGLVGVPPLAAPPAEPLAKLRVSAEIVACGSALANRPCALARPMPSGTASRTTPRPRSPNASRESTAKPDCCAVARSAGAGSRRRSSPRRARLPEASRSIACRFIRASRSSRSSRAPARSRKDCVTRPSASPVCPRLPPTPSSVRPAPRDRSGSASCAASGVAALQRRNTQRPKRFIFIAILPLSCCLAD